MEELGDVDDGLRRVIGDVIGDVIEGTLAVNSLSGSCRWRQGLMGLELALLRRRYNSSRHLIGDNSNKLVLAGLGPVDLRHSDRQSWAGVADTAPAVGNRTLRRKGHVDTS